MASVTEIGYVGNISLPRLRSLSIRETVPRDRPECPGLLNFIDAPLLEVLNLSGMFLTSSLSALVQRSPILQKLFLEYDENDFTSLAETFYHCPSLLSLDITRSDDYDMMHSMYFRPPIVFSNAFFEAFVCNGVPTPAYIYTQGKNLCFRGVHPPVSYGKA